MPVSPIEKLPWVFIMSSEDTTSTGSERQQQNANDDAGKHIVINTPVTASHAYNVMLEHYGSCVWVDMLPLVVHNEMFDPTALRDANVIKYLEVQEQ